MVGALALFQMGSAVVQGVYHLGQLGKNIDVVGMLVLLVASALLPISCGNWRATYAHPYIHTRESLADDDGEGSGRRGDDRSPRGRRLRCVRAITQAPFFVCVRVLKLDVLMRLCFARGASLT
jgi:hypothetical protein